MIQLPDTDCTVTVSESVGSLDERRGYARKITVLVEHVPSGVKADDYFEGYYTDAQVEVKAQQMAQAVARDLMVAISVNPQG